MLHKTKIRVRYGETDQMGIVYHPNYYIYFEMGRSEFLRELGHMSYKDMEESGIMMPLIETHCKYILPAKYDDELIVETSVKNVTVVRMISSAYNTGITEASCPNLRQTLTDSLVGIQQMQFTVFDAMRRQGWYQTKDAPDQDVNNAKNKYGNVKNQL